jgi:hypothetical protein
MDIKAVNKALRSDLWTFLRARGFELRTDRSAWRYLDGSVDVIDIQSVGASNADACGCTTYSFNAFIASIPSFQPTPPGCIDKDGRVRPHYWNCNLQMTLNKTLQQPWFTPFVRQPSSNTPASFLSHRAGLTKVLRRDRHDRPDIWFVLEDGSNLGEVLEDLRNAVETVGLPMLDLFHDPCQVVGLLQDSTLYMQANSPAGIATIEAAQRACAERQ